MTESELYDHFLQWLDIPICNYSSDEIEVLWEEFYEKHPNGITSWQEDK